MSEQQGVPWKWVAVTAVGILVAVIGGVFSYGLSANSNQITELKTINKEQDLRIRELTDKISKNERRMATMGVALSGARRTIRHLMRRGRRPAMMMAKPPHRPHRPRRHIRIYLPKKR